MALSSLKMYWFHAIFSSCILNSTSVFAFSIGKIQEEIKSFTSTKIAENKPLTATILCLPSNYYVPEDVIFRQKATATTIQGFEKIQKMCSCSDDCFQSELGVSAAIERISSTSPDSASVNWNVTWVPPTSVWLETLAQVWPGVDAVYSSYNHLSGEKNIFSWKAVGKLFSDALTTGQLRVPLACIEGITTLHFDTSTDEGRVSQISEDLVYAMDLQNGKLQNRKCSDDLRIFLESGRRIATDNDENNNNNYNNDWDDAVATRLPWSSVAGSNVLDVDPTEEGDGAAIAFLGFVGLVLVAFANIAGPELIGQSLFGPPHYIVKPEDLNSFY